MHRPEPFTRVSSHWCTKSPKLFENPQIPSSRPLCRGRIFRFCCWGMPQNRKIPPQAGQTGRILRFCCWAVPQNRKIPPRAGRTGRILRFCCWALRQNRKILPRNGKAGRILRLCRTPQPQNRKILPRREALPQRRGDSQTTSAISCIGVARVLADSGGYARARCRDSTAPQRSGWGMWRAVHIAKTIP